MADTERSDHVEDELETVKKLLISAASYAESSHKRIDDLSARQDLTQRQLDNLSVKVEVMSEKIDKLGEKIDTFVSKADSFIETTQARNAVFSEIILRLEENQSSTNAAIERLERILVRLITP